MNATKVVVVERHADGRLYPPRWWDLPPQVVEHLRGLEHHLRCVERLSYRQVVAAMLDRFGERRSLGQVWKDVHNYECPSCAPRPALPPDPRQKARVVAWR
jgi:hypothetical protein